MPGSAEISIIHRLDVDVSEEEDHELRLLLISCFPFVTVLLTRRYVHEMPGHRWLGRAASGELVAHVAVHDKVIVAGGKMLRIGGVAEVCVAHAFRGRGLVRSMLAEAHGWMEGEGIPFAMLFGHPKVYGSSGYSVIENQIKTETAIIQNWNPFKGKPMVRAIGKEVWPDGAVDLRGPTF